MAQKKGGDVVDLSARLLREIRDGQKEGFNGLRREMKAGFSHANDRLDSMAHHLALVSRSLMSLAEQTDKSIDDLRRRVEKLEKRG